MDAAFFSLQVKIALESLILLSLVLTVWLFILVWRGYPSTPGTCVHGVVFVIERPMHQGVMLDTLIVPLGSLVRLVARYLFNKHSAYAAWRLLWTMK